MIEPDIGYTCPHCGKKTEPIVFKRCDGTMESEPSCKFCGSKTPQNIIEKIIFGNNVLEEGHNVGKDYISSNNTEKITEKKIVEIIIAAKSDDSFERVYQLLNVYIQNYSEKIRRLEEKFNSVYKEAQNILDIIGEIKI
jgi:hypothetical protein